MCHLSASYNKEGIKKLLDRKDLDEKLRKSLEDKLKKLESNENVLK